MPERPPPPVPTPLRGAPATAPDAVLTPAEVAAWLRLRPRQVQRLGVPCINLGRKTKRYLRKDVLAWLDGKRRGA